MGEDGAGLPRATRSGGPSVCTNPRARAGAAATRLERALWLESARRRTVGSAESYRERPAIQRSRRAPRTEPRASCLEPGDPQAEGDAGHLERRRQRKQNEATEHGFIEHAQQLRVDQPEIEIHTGDDDGEQPNLRALAGRPRPNLVRQLNVELDGRRQLDKERSGRLCRQVVGVAEA